MAHPVSARGPLTALTLSQAGPPREREGAAPGRLAGGVTAQLQPQVARGCRSAPSTGRRDAPGSDPIIQRFSVFKALALSTVSAIVLGGSALAADLPRRAAPPLL